MTLTTWRVGVLFEILVDYTDNALMEFFFRAARAEQRLIGTSAVLTLTQQSMENIFKM
jgi:hypothetical protein